MKNATIKSLLAISMLAAGIAHATPGGTITSLTASSLKPKIGEPVTVTIGGTLEAGRKCHIAGGAVSPYEDLGLVSAFPYTIPKSYTFNENGPHYIHVYVGTTDPDNTCLQTGPTMVKIDVGAANGNISGLTASTLTPKVGEAVTIKLDGTLDPGKKCHIYGGTKSPYVDLGLVSAFPHTIATTFKFDTIGPQYIHVYLGTQDKENVCTQTSPTSVKVDVIANPVRVQVPILINKPNPIAIPK